jgi:hypothetical protein
VGGGDGVEQVDGCVPHSMVAVDVEELAAGGAVEALEGRLVWSHRNTGKITSKLQRKNNSRKISINIRYIIILAADDS